MVRASSCGRSGHGASRAVVGGVVVAHPRTRPQAVPYSGRALGTQGDKISLAVPRPIRRCEQRPVYRPRGRGQGRKGRRIAPPACAPLACRCAPSEARPPKPRSKKNDRKSLGRSALPPTIGTSATLAAPSARWVDTVIRLLLSPGPHRWPPRRF